MQQRIKRVRFFLLLWLVMLLVAEPVIAACSDAPAPNVQWRRCYQDGEILTRVNLAGAELRDSYLTRADISFADLTKVDARGTKFIRADMRDVSLQGANLTRTDFTQTNLEGADFSDSNLYMTKFFKANLRGANFTGADMHKVDFLKADLSGALWVDGERRCAEGSIGQCRMIRPSTPEGIPTDPAL